MGAWVLGTDGLMGVTTAHGSRVQNYPRPEAALVRYSQTSLDGAICPSQDFQQASGLQVQDSLQAYQAPRSPLAGQCSECQLTKEGREQVESTF